ncbi:hypothetical protein SAZ11_04170 [Streptomyces sp. FXJ1.4098]|nr:hypothetical protein [Streptomyces sp. FXJ1.4098]
MTAPRPADRFDAFQALAARRGRPENCLLEALARARAVTVDGPEAWAPEEGVRAGLPSAAALGPASYSTDFVVPHGRRHVRVCAAAPASRPAPGTTSPRWKLVLVSLRGAPRRTGDLAAGRSLPRVLLREARRPGW